jgi:predicted glycosyltransferase
MKEGTFSPYASKLIAEGAIMEIEKAVGTTPSVYMWPEEYAESCSNDPPMTHHLDVFSE